MALTKKQESLVNDIKKMSGIKDGLNTHQIAVNRGDYQAYETCLRDRLFRLAGKGFLKFTENHKNGFVIERKWFLEVAK